MKKLLFTAALMAAMGVANSQNLSVTYSADFTCDADLFFAVRTEIGNDVYYRLTFYKTALPGSSVSFDLATDMSDVYLPAADFTDPTRPMFGGARSELTVYYDAGMLIGETETQPVSFCTGESGNTYYTRDGEFHWDIRR